MSLAHDAIAELLNSTIELAERLSVLERATLDTPSGHPCAYGGDTWQLIANLVDHDIEHAGQLAGARHQSGNPRTAVQRLLAEWIEARAQVASHLVGMSDAQFEDAMMEGQWSYRESVEHITGLQRYTLDRLGKEGLA